MVEDAGAEGAEMAVEPGSTTQVEGEDGGAHEGAEQAAFQASWSQFAAKPTSFSPLAAAATDFQAPDFTNNFLKDALWSPDGLCILTSSDDNSVRLFEAPSWASDPAQLKSEWGQEHDCMRSVLQVKEGETIYDLAWYPGMNSSSPATCCFFSTSRDNPVHVWDAFTGADRGSYCAYTDAEELTAAYSVGFDSQATKLYCGYNNCIRVFDVERPGRSHSLIKTFARAHHQSTGQRGIISSIAFCPDRSGLFAAASYSRNVALFSSSPPTLLYNLTDHRGGITQVMWSRDGNYLFTGARKDDEILCWDVRNTGEVCLRLQRECPTNQRLRFDIDASGRYLITPTYSQGLKVFDLWNNGADAPLHLVCPSTMVNGVSLHPTAAVVAVSTGGRTFEMEEDEEDEEDVAGRKKGKEQPRNRWDSAVLLYQLSGWEADGAAEGDGGTGMVEGAEAV